MKKNLFAIIVAMLGLSFSANTWAAFYLNVINKAHSGILTKIYETGKDMHSDGVSTFPEQENPTTIAFYVDQSYGFSQVKIGTPDAKSYCKVKVINTLIGDQAFATHVELTSNFSCSFHEINQNTGELVIEKIENA